jgi:hypothetical protein
MTARQTQSAPYGVGYGKPPRHTQFRKGQSGNPGGRPRGLPVRRANALLLQEAYRPVAIKEDGRMVPVSALQAVLRSQIELAINGNGRAQRAVLEAVQHLELLKSIGQYDDRIETDEDCETDETSEIDATNDAGAGNEIGGDDETGGDDTGETGSDETGAAVKTAAAPARPSEDGAAPPIFSAAPPVRPAPPKAPPLAPSASRRPGLPSPDTCTGRAARREAARRRRDARRWRRAGHAQAGTNPAQGFRISRKWKNSLLTSLFSGNPGRRPRAVASGLCRRSARRTADGGGTRRSQATHDVMRGFDRAARRDILMGSSPRENHELS